ncbi:DUF7504 family protein [Natrinema salifodinae]|uniref:RecA-superfamily ATPase, KaiC/GvpD/RAD55 family n=1 Tax=Natrinema salifodinae TaxID=1202768 RepID=A0A1I0N3A6_9EURY|nr:hypothetical protein [Natrinema salifodinae]SEV95560.1 hypothetical protein SAMN05216285_1297 [Natrinema salifodinae]
MEDEGGRSAPVRASVTRALGTLKREGCNVLLVGSEATSAHETVCRQFLGASAAEAPFRLFVRAVGQRETDQASCGPVDESETDRVQTIECASATLDPTTASAIGALGIEIVEAIDAFADSAAGGNSDGGLEPASLRVCVDSLGPLLEAYDAEAVFRLLHVTTTRVDQADGIGHYHLPIAPDHDAVSLLEPLFDAVVTVRTRDGADEQRWSLQEADAPTDWLAVSAGQRS